MNAEEIRAVIGRPTNPYDTHRLVLAEAIIHTQGAILELGMGMGSTPGLHEIAKRSDRLVVSYEDDRKWFDQFSHLAVEDVHSINWVATFEDARVESPWGVALVDHGSMARRVREIGRLAQWADIVVVHDTEDARYHYWSAYSLFNYRFDYMKVTPWTTAFSNTHDFQDWAIL